MKKDQTEFYKKNWISIKQVAEMSGLEISGVHWRASRIKNIRKVVLQPGPLSFFHPEDAEKIKNINRDIPDGYVAGNSKAAELLGISEGSFRRNIKPLLPEEAIIKWKWFPVSKNHNFFYKESEIKKIFQDLENAKMHRKRQSKEKRENRYKRLRQEKLKKREKEKGNLLSPKEVIEILDLRNTNSLYHRVKTGKLKIIKTIACQHYYDLEEVKQLAKSEKEDKREIYILDHNGNTIGLRCSCGKEGFLAKEPRLEGNFDQVKDARLGYRTSCRECKRKTHYTTIERAAKRRFYHMNQRAKLKGRVRQLTLEDVEELVKQPCAYTGIAATFNEKEGIWENVPSIDRIDSSKGYTLKNTQPCQWFINKMKSDLPQDKFLEACQLVAEYTNQRKK